jgi:nickel superoxide dismutase
MKKVNELSTDFSKHTNQVIRWVQNKEQHADKFTEILTQYFLSQRIKANKDEVKYVNHLKLIHHLMVLSMKSKQSTDLEITSKMKKTLAKFEASYFNKKALKHLKEHK